MSQISPTSSGGPQTAYGKDLRDVDINQFLQLLIAQMQNQDPLSPMENSEILQQIGQIREISATNKLTDTLDAVLLGQNLATASSLIGREVKALTDDARDVTGIIDRVSVETSGEKNEKRTLRVHIGGSRIDLRNIREILPVEPQNSSGLPSDFLDLLF